MSHISPQKFLTGLFACLSGSLFICLSANAQNYSSLGNQNVTQLSNLSQNFNTQSFLLAQTRTKRVALVIGNSNYANGSNLRNPVNDANDMAKVLRGLDFDVILLTDANLRSMDQALERFYQKLQSGAVGLFYYAGHGVQVNGENYLVPVDADLARESEVSYEAVPLGKLLGAIRDIENDVNIIILDACRDNPFARSWTRSSRSRGLAPVQNSATGSFIAYATGPGNTAQDGTGRNGTFTEALLKHLPNENQNIEEIFKRVRVDVAKKTKNEQVPWTTSSLIGDFFFSQTTTADSLRETVTNTTTTVSNNNQPVETRTNNQAISASNQQKLPTQTQAVEPKTDLVATNNATTTTNNNQDTLESTSLETKQDIMSRLNDMTSNISSRVEKLTGEMNTPEKKNTIATNSSRTFFAGSPPKLVEFRTPHNKTSYPSPTYYVTIKMPSDSTASLARLSIEQQENVDSIEFHLDKTEAFITDENNNKVTVPVTVTRSPNSANTLNVMFGTAIEANSSVTIKFKGKPHPSFDGIFQFRVEAFPEGVNPVGLNLGTSRIQIYKTF